MRLDAVGRRQTGAATRRTGRNVRVVFDCGPFPPLYENITSSENRKYVTYHTAVRGGPSHGHRWHLQNIWWNLGVCFFRYASGQTNKQTHRHADNNTSPPCEVIANSTTLVILSGIAMCEIY